MEQFVWLEVVPGMSVSGYVVMGCCCEGALLAARTQKGLNLVHFLTRSTSAV